MLKMKFSAPTHLKFDTGVWLIYFDPKKWHKYVSEDGEDVNDDASLIHSSTSTINENVEEVNKTGVLSNNYL